MIGVRDGSREGRDGAVGQEHGRMPTLRAQWMSSCGRSPTNTQLRGSVAPTAVIAAANACGCGLVQSISLV
jgi:hypothetical protein